MKNMEIRETAKRYGVYLWEVAATYGINDGNFSRKLRNELPQEEKEKILAIIRKIAEDRLK
jgi:hypothetical protein